MTDQPAPETESPAVLLHRAAKVLRERATAAGPGPWTATPRVLYGVAVHPGVGLALADWLETEAATWAGDEVHNRCSAKTCTLDAALVVARQVLGEKGGAR